MPRAKRDDDEFLDDSDSDAGSIDERDLADATLPEPQPVQIKVSTLHRRYRNGLIELNPYYQRDVVWPAMRQSGLINSIFNNYYIPPVIFQVLKVYNPATPNARPTIYQTTIDGKQRLSSIIEFMAGRIPYKDPRGVTWWYPVLEAKHRKGKLLTKELKDRFDNWSLLCIEYEGLKQQQEEDLFARVQQGMALSNNEKQMASHTPWIKLIKEIMKTYKGVTELCIDLKRGKDFGNVANVIVTAFYSDMRKANEPLGLKSSQASLSKVVNKMDYGPPSAKFATRMRLLFKVWTDLFNASPQTFSNEFTAQILKNFAPIEFLAVGILLHIHMDDRDNETLIGDVNAMRKYIRTGGKALDLRTNTNTWRWFWSFITDLEGHRGSGKRPTAASRIPPAAMPIEIPGSVPNVQRDKLVLASGPVAPSSSTPSKRKTTKSAKARANAENSEDDESDVPQPRTRKRKATAALDEEDDYDEPGPSTRQKSKSKAAADDSDDEEEEEDDEIFRASGKASQLAPPVTNPPPQNLPIQNNSMFPAGFTPEMYNMFTQMQAFSAAQQAQNQGQPYQMPQFQMPTAGFPQNMPYNAGQQQWPMQYPPQQQQQQNRQEQSLPANGSMNGAKKSTKRKSAINIDL